MRTLKRLIQRAKQLITDTVYWFATDGLFIEALGLDPEDYIVPYRMVNMVMMIWLH